MPVTLMPMILLRSATKPRDGTAAKIKEENQKRAFGALVIRPSTKGAGEESSTCGAAKSATGRFQSTLGELAYFNGLRELVKGIHHQDLFAQHGGSAPIRNFQCLSRRLPLQLHRGPGGAGSRGPAAAAPAAPAPHLLLPLLACSSGSGAAR